VFIKLEGAQRLAGCVLLTGLVAGCLNLGGGRRSDAEFLLDDWLQRTQGLVGVQPPREDVRVGDVHLYFTNPEGAKPLGLYAMPRWDNLSAADELEAEFRKRSEFPPTPAEYVQSEFPTEGRRWEEPVGDRGVFTPLDRVDRLPASSWTASA
jgi:hypothetical protein